MSKALWISAGFLLIVNFALDKVFADKGPFIENETQSQSQSQNVAQVENIVKISKEVTKINRKEFPSSSSREIASDVSDSSLTASQPSQAESKEPEIIRLNE